MPLSLLTDTLSRLGHCHWETERNWTETPDFCSFASSQCVQLGRGVTNCSEIYHKCWTKICRLWRCSKYFTYFSYSSNHAVTFHTLCFFTHLFRFFTCLYANTEHVKLITRRIRAWVQCNALSKNFCSSYFRWITVWRTYAFNYNVGVWAACTRDLSVILLSGNNWHIKSISTTIWQICFSVNTTCQW